MEIVGGKRRSDKTRRSADRRKTRDDILMENSALERVQRHWKAIIGNENFRLNKAQRYGRISFVDGGGEMRKTLSMRDVNQAGVGSVIPKTYEWNCH
jgi:hypothetical protein